MSCEPTADRSAKEYREPTMHRSLEWPGEPTQLAGEMSVVNASTGTSRSLGGFPGAVSWDSPLAELAGNLGVSVIVAVHCQTTGTSGLGPRQRLRSPDKRAVPTPIGTIRCRFPTPEAVRC